MYTFDSCVGINFVEISSTILIKMQWNWRLLFTFLYLNRNWTVNAGADFQTFRFCLGKQIYYLQWQVTQPKVSSGGEEVCVCVVCVVCVHVCGSIPQDSSPPPTPPLCDYTGGLHQEKNDSTGHTDTHTQTRQAVSSSIWLLKSHQRDQLSKMMRCHFLTLRCFFIKYTYSFGCFWKPPVKLENSILGWCLDAFDLSELLLLEKKRHPRMPVGHNESHIHTHTHTHTHAHTHTHTHTHTHAHTHAHTHRYEADPSSSKRWRGRCMAWVAELCTCGYLNSFCNKIQFFASGFFQWIWLGVGCFNPLVPRVQKNSTN